MWIFIRFRAGVWHPIVPAVPAPFSAGQACPPRICFCDYIPSESAFEVIVSCPFAVRRSHRCPRSPMRLLNRSLYLLNIFPCACPVQSASYDVHTHTYTPKHTQQTQMQTVNKYTYIYRSDYDEDVCTFNRNLVIIK